MWVTEIGAVQFGDRWSEIARDPRKVSIHLDIPLSQTIPKQREQFFVSLANEKCRAVGISRR